MLRIGWFSSGGGKASRDLLITTETAIRRRELDVEIEFVFCTRDPGESFESNLFFRVVNACHKPFVSISYDKFKTGVEGNRKVNVRALPEWRLDYDRRIMQALDNFNPDVCVLAGYMLVTGAEMCRRFNMLNLHPAAPGGPAGTWQQVIWKLIDTDAQETGVMMHLATPELDKGPLVTYCTFPIRGGIFDPLWAEVKGKSVTQIKKESGEAGHLFQAIRAQGLAREVPLILTTLKAISQNKLHITPEKTVVDFEGKPIDGYNLTGEIDRKGQI